MRRALGIAAAAALAAGCSGTFPETFPFVPPEPRPGTEQGAWAKERDRFTADAKLYDGLAVRAFVSAVYQAPSVRSARVARVAVWRELAPADRDQLLAAESDEAARYDDFIVALFTPDRPDNDLSSPRSIWRVALAVQGEGEQEPQSVNEVRPDAALRELYPTVGDFDTVYRVRFARWSAGPLSDRTFTLRMSGARGRIDLGFPRKPGNKVARPAGVLPEP